MDRPVCQDSPEARTWLLRAVCHDEENFLQRPVRPISCVACIKAVVSKVLQPTNEEPKYLIFSFLS